MGKGGQGKGNGGGNNQDCQDNWQQQWQGGPCRNRRPPGSAIHYKDDVLIMNEFVCSSCLEGMVLGIYSDSPRATNLNRRICIFLDAESLCRFLVLDSASRTGTLEIANGLLHVHKLRAQRREIIYE